MTRFEFRIFPVDEMGAMNTSDQRVEFAACHPAGVLAKKNDGPADLAYEDEEPWNARYVTTAAPSGCHPSGFRPTGQLMVEGRTTPASRWCEGG